MDVIIAKTTEHLRRSRWVSKSKMLPKQLHAGCVCGPKMPSPRNAFGTVDRRKMLEEVKSHCLCLFPYAAACFRNANVLMGDGYALESLRGVQQRRRAWPLCLLLPFSPW